MSISPIFRTAIGYLTFSLAILLKAVENDLSFVITRFAISLLIFIVISIKHSLFCHTNDPPAICFLLHSINIGYITFFLALLTYGY